MHAAAERPFTVVDIHSHWYPPAYLEVLRTRRVPPLVRSTSDGDRFVIFPNDHGRLIGEAFWDLSQKLDYMDRAGISHSLVSLGNPWLDPFEPGESQELAGELNRQLAGLVTSSGGRLIGMGVLPSGPVEAVVRFAHDIGRTPGLCGVITGTRPAGFELDHEALDPLWEELNASRLPLFVHPHYCFGAADLGGHGYVLPLGLGFPFETTVALSRLILAGVLFRHPHLRVAAAHAAGVLPFLAGRLDAVWASDPGVRDRLPVPPATQLSQLFLDGLVYSEASLRAATELVGTARIGLGTDHPFGIGSPELILKTFTGAIASGQRAQVLSESAVFFFDLARDIAPPTNHPA